MTDYPDSEEISEDVGAVLRRPGLSRRSCPQSAARAGPWFGVTPDD
jgi:hypothetical protein